jgi:hypothetical protein
MQSTASISQRRIVLFAMTIKPEVSSQLLTGKSTFPGRFFLETRFGGFTGKREMLPATWAFRSTHPADGAEAIARWAY